MLWKPIAAFSESVPAVAFLEGEAAQELLREYNAVVESQFNNVSALRALAYHREIKTVTGSNPFAAALMNRVVSGHGVHIATPTTIERVLTSNALPLRGYYVDVGLVLRNQSEPNSYLASHLAAQLQGQRFPVMVPLSACDVEYDPASPCKLVFRISDDSQVISSLKFAYANHGKQFLHTDSEGLPDFQDAGKRFWYTATTGLCRYVLDRDLSLASRRHDLSVTYPDGRLILMRDGSHGRT